MKKTIPILLSAALLLSACGQAASTAETAATADAPAAMTETAAQTAAPKTTPGGVDKSETVYAKANADGTVTETTVEAVLKARDGATIPDVAALRDIINKEGDEEYTTGADNALTWQNSGSAITYEGKSDAALPVTTRVTYYLNGVETALDDLADGLTQLYSSGTALVDGANALRDGLSAVSLAVGNMTSGDAGSSEESMAAMESQLTPVVKNYADTLVSEVVSDDDLKAALTAYGITGDNQTAVLYAVATAMGKSLDKNTLPMVQGVAGTVSGAIMGQMGEGIGQLQTGLDQLASGSAELARGADTYVKAVGQVSQGADALAEGSAQLDDASDAMYEGLAELHDGAQELHDGVQEFSDKSSGDLSDDLGSGLRNVVRRLKAVQQAGKNYQTFSGLPADSTGSVKFIVETAEIKK